MPTPSGLQEDVASAAIAQAVEAALAVAPALGSPRKHVDKPWLKQDDGWTCDSWLKRLDLAGRLTNVLLQKLSNEAKECSESQLAFMRTIGGGGSKATLLALLKEGNALEALVDLMWPALQLLCTGPATAKELQANFVNEGAGDLLFGDLDSFFRGLEPRIGSPHPHVFQEMQNEHTVRGDSRQQVSASDTSRLRRPTSHPPTSPPATSPLAVHDGQLRHRHIL